MNENKRTLYFILITLGVGGIIALYTWFSSMSYSSGVGTETTTSSDTLAIQEVVRKEISQLSEKDVTPAQYNNLRTEITGYAQQGDLTESLKESLLNALNDTYTEKSLIKAQGLLSKNPLPEKQILEILEHISSVGVADRKQINAIKAKVLWYQNYTQKLPAEIEIFCEKSTAQFREDGNFDSTQYNDYKTKVGTVEGEFLNNTQVQRARQEMDQMLNDMYNLWEKKNRAVESMYDLSM